MKKNLFLLLFFFLYVGSYQAKGITGMGEFIYEYRVDSENVPKRAKRYMKKNYLEAYDIKWDYKNGEGFYTSKFKIKGDRYKLMFDSKGKLVYSKGNIQILELPSKMKRYIKKNYSEYQISKVEKIKHFKQITYKVKINTQSYSYFKDKVINFNSKGEILN